MPIAITLFYASLLVIILLVLSVRVVALRRKHQVGVGTGGEPSLTLAVRAHGNFCEYVPPALLMLLLLELGTHLPAWFLHLLGATLLLGRILHGLVGLNRSAGASPGRFIGTALTWLVLAVSAIAGVLTALGWWFAVQT